MPTLALRPAQIRLLIGITLGVALLAVSDWIFFDQRLVLHTSPMEHFSLHTAFMVVLVCSFLLLRNTQQISRMVVCLIGAIYCGLLVIPSLQEQMNMGHASPATLFAFATLFLGGLFSIRASSQALRAFVFFLFASVQSIGVMGVAQYVLGLKASSPIGPFPSLSAATGLSLIVLSPLVFFQIFFGAADPEQPSGQSHSGLPLSLFLLPIGLAALPLLTTLLQPDLLNGHEAIAAVLAFSSLLSCVFLFASSAHFGEMEQRTGNMLSSQALELAKLYQDQLNSVKLHADEQRRFSDILAHEIRTPLSTVLGLVELLRREKSTQLQSVNCLQNVLQIEMSAKLLREMTNAVLNFAKVKAGKMDMQTTACDVRVFLAELKSIFSGVAKRRKISLFVDTPKADHAFLRFDSTHVREVLSNLIDNALKFTDQGGEVRVRFEQTRDESNERVRFKVIDNGPGIAEKDAELVFQPFRQASEGISRRHDGTGLGLSYSQELAELMKGSLTLESKQGLGCCFMLDIPVKSATQEEVAETTEEGHSEFKGKPLNLNALMVEDHPLNARIHSHLLKLIGVHCDWAESGEVAIEKIKAGNTYELILMDINLGEGLSGLETTLVIRELLGVNTPPVLALTAVTLDEEVQQFADYGLKAIIPKPFDLSMAHTTIHGVLETEES